jgi:hypothetical protein
VNHARPHCNRLAQAGRRTRHRGPRFINGRFTDALSGETRPTVNPANGRELAEVALCGPADADLAIKGARAAFASGAWSEMAPMERKMVLVRWAELIDRHREELALLETLDVGKPISDTLNVDVPSAVRTIRWSGEAIDKVYDEIPPTPRDTLALVQRLPLGVVAAIVPWNFPLSTTAWKLAPSWHRQLVVLGRVQHAAVGVTSRGWPPRPACRTACCRCCPAAVRWASTWPRTWTSMADLHRLDAGRQTLMQYSGQSNLKRTFLELGGKAEHRLADADLEKAAAGRPWPCSQRRADLPPARA